MTTLYNCHHDGDQYRVTKFEDGNHTSSYLTTHAECQCPAGSRLTCRHRQMLPLFLAKDLINTPWFLDWDRGGHVVDFMGLPIPAPTTPATDRQTFTIPDGHEAIRDKNGYATGEVRPMPQFTPLTVFPQCTKPWRRI